MATGQNRFDRHRCVSYQQWCDTPSFAHGPDAIAEFKRSNGEIQSSVCVSFCLCWKCKNRQPNDIKTKSAKYCCSHSSSEKSRLLFARWIMVKFGLSVTFFPYISLSLPGFFPESLCFARLEALPRVICTSTSRPCVCIYHGDFSPIQRSPESVIKRTFAVFYARNILVFICYCLWFFPDNYCE